MRKKTTAEVHQYHGLSWISTSQTAAHPSSLSLIPQARLQNDREFSLPLAGNSIFSFFFFFLASPIPHRWGNLKARELEEGGKRYR